MLGRSTSDRVLLPEGGVHARPHREKWLRLFEQLSPIYKWASGGLAKVPLRHSYAPAIRLSPGYRVPRRHRRDLRVRNRARLGPDVQHRLFNTDFTVGYSPERINPGDRQRRLAAIIKVTSGSAPEAAEFVDARYRRIVTAGARVLACSRLGFTFKENCPDLRNTRVIDLARELQGFRRQGRCLRPLGHPTASAGPHPGKQVSVKVKRINSKPTRRIQALCPAL